MSSDVVLKLNADCRHVVGGAFSAIYDLTRGRIFRFSSEHNHVISTILNRSCSKEYDCNESDDLVERQIITFLLDKELAEYRAVSIAGMFPELDLTFDNSTDVLDAIIDVSDTWPNMPLLIRNLESLGCQLMQLRSYGSLANPSKVVALMNLLTRSTIGRVNILARWSEKWTTLTVGEMFDRFTNLGMIELHSAPLDDLFEGSVLSRSGRGLLRLSREPITGPAACGRITRGTLAVPKTSIFTYHATFNGCLHGKVSIRSDGEICNCPSMRKSYGKNLETLPTIVRSTEFRMPWYARKDIIAVCQGCEYRYACSDCRAYLDGDDSLSKPARCAYDPVTGVWAV